MRAKTINEAQEFQRGQDPLDTMNLGHPEIRKINSSLKQVQEIVSAGYNLDELDFPDTIEAIDNLKGMILIVIQNYLKKNFNWDFYPLDEGTGEEALSADIGKGYELRIQLSSSLKSYVFKLYTRNNYVVSMPASTNLKSMDKKAREIIKKYLK
jgi:hypothetical protein